MKLKTLLIAGLLTSYFGIASAQQSNDNTAPEPKNTELTQESKNICIFRPYARIIHESYMDDVNNVQIITTHSFTDTFYRTSNAVFDLKTGERKEYKGQPKPNTLGNDQTLVSDYDMYLQASENIKKFGTCDQSHELYEDVLEIYLNAQFKNTDAEKRFKTEIAEHHM